MMVMGDRPLYGSADIEALPKSGHVGLWYDKFCHAWTNLSKTAAEIDKGAWIAQVLGPCGNRDELARKSERQRKMIQCLNGRCVDLQTVGPFVTGLSRDHPVENGFLWHHTLGVPYLPGSSVKGMVGAWAKHWQREEEAAWRAILGTKRHVGDVVFFDAFPKEPVALVRDVMTPHYGEYYRDGKPPGDWIDPNPIPFLAVGQGATLRFAVAPRQPSAEGESHCELACRWLAEALEWIGAGAKTAVGYGRFGEARPTPPRPLVKGEAVEAILYRDDRRRWCGRTEDGQSGTIFGQPPDDAAADGTRTLYVRVPPRNLQFQWTVGGSDPSTGRRSPGRTRHRSHRH